MTSLFDAAYACLRAATCEEKIRRTQTTYQALQRGELSLDSNGPIEPIRMPGRPEKPTLVSPRDLPRRGFGTVEGRAAFIHAIAHIELNAVDLAWDAIYRFRDMPAQYYADWASTANDEAKHFTLLRERLQQLGYDYGSFDAHNGLWEMAEKTAHDGLARMALVPRVLEARGLDVTPAMIKKLRTLKDHDTVAILQIILDEEVAHVAAGTRWYRWHCERAGVNPLQRFRELLNEHATGVLQSPFNDEARMQAGFNPDELRLLDEIDQRVKHEKH